MLVITTLMANIQRCFLLIFSSVTSSVVLHCSSYLFVVRVHETPFTDTTLCSPFTSTTTVYFWPHLHGSLTNESTLDVFSDCRPCTYSRLVQKGPISRFDPLRVLNFLLEVRFVRPINWARLIVGSTEDLNNLSSTSIFI